jgi:hypothetical protein
VKRVLLATPSSFRPPVWSRVPFWGGLEGGDRLWPVTWVVWAPVGALILWKRPPNGVGVTMLGIGLAWGICFLLSGLRLELPYVSRGPCAHRLMEAVLR